MVWQMAGENPLRPKGKGKGRGIMISDFLLPFGRLGFSRLSNDNQNSLLAATVLAGTGVVENFEYEKYNDGYWDGHKLLEEVIDKAVPIVEALFEID